MKYEIPLDRQWVKIVNNGQQWSAMVKEAKQVWGTVQDFSLKNLKIPCILHCVGIILYPSIMQINAIAWYWHSIISWNISLWSISVICKTNQPWFLAMVYSRKIQTWGRGFEDMEFSGVLKKIECENCKGQLKKK